MPAQRTRSGVTYDTAVLDLVERRFWREIWAAVPAGVATDRGIEARSFRQVQATIVSALPGARMLNLVLGASDKAGAVGGGDLDRALDRVDSRGVSAYVP